MDEVSYDEAKEDYRPKPNEFDTFLPWACQQLQVNASIIVVNMALPDYVSAGQTDRIKSKGKSKANIQNITDNGSKSIHETSESDMQMNELEHDITVKILAYYDSNKNLIEIKFEKNKRVPRDIMKIIGLTLPFHSQLHAVTINKGLDKFVIHELQKLLLVSNITDVCLDNTYFAEACYDILLQSQTKLRHLSLARCGLNDKVCQKIASKLVYPQPASHFLSVLNLSSNKITDLGAKYLGDALKSNRKLTYLNLAGNTIGDDGARSILNTLQEFPLTYEEILLARSRKVDYLKNRNELIDQLTKKLKTDNFDKRLGRKSIKPIKPVSVAPTKKVGKSLEKDSSFKNIQDCILNMDTVGLEKVQVMADNILGEFDDPFDSKNIELRDSIVYCNGNNTLCYINMAYNSLSYLSVKLLLNVLVEQKRMDRKPKGLLNVVIEGNCIPKPCLELILIDQIIDDGLTLDPKMMGKKKPLIKSAK